MDKILTTAILALAVMGGFLIGILMKNENSLGALNVLPSAYSAAENASVSVGYWTKILSADNHRNWASICNDGAGVVYLSETSTAPTATTTYVGFPIASSTAYEHCYIIDANHPYTGDVYGLIGSTTTVVKIIVK